jgi:hypothetical protein
MKAAVPAITLSITSVIDAIAGSRSSRADWSGMPVKGSGLNIAKEGVIWTKDPEKSGT